eukprot:SAG31_NODE_7359_length_1711_cov_1.023573_2_plen_113_part_00
MRVLVKLGCACKLAGSQRPDPSGSYSLDQVEPVVLDSTAPPYLGGTSSVLQKVFLYHSQADAFRAVFGLFDTTTKVGKIVVVSRQGKMLVLKRRKLCCRNGREGIKLIDFLF